MNTHTEEIHILYSHLQLSSYLSIFTFFVSLRILRTKLMISVGGWYKYTFWRDGDIQFSDFSCSVMSNSLQPHGLQNIRPEFYRTPSQIPGVYSNSCPLSWWCHPTISSSVVPSPPAFNLSQHQSLLKWVSSSHQMTKFLEFQLQDQSFQWIFRNDFL